MTQKEIECLLTIVLETTNQNEMDDISIQLPVATSEERKMICNSLECKGYIIVLDVYGQNYIRCNVQEKALKYALAFYRENPNYSLDAEK